MRVRTGLRSESDGRILISARRKRLGKWTRLPTLWLGSRVPRFSGLDDAGEAITQVFAPARSGASSPRDPVGDPEERLIRSAPVLEHQSGFWPTMTADGSLIVEVVLAALDHEALDGSPLERADDVPEAPSTGLELGDSVATATHHDERLDRP